MVLHTFQVSPKVPGVEYKPHVGIIPNWSREYYSGTTTAHTTCGDSFSYTNEAGTWTVSAEGDYVWNWVAHTSPHYAASLRPRSSIPLTLISEGLSLSSSTTITDFEVTYVDDGPPSYVRVYIDGSAYDMDYVRGAERSYADGALFSHTTVLSPGQHTYYFEASDGSLTARFPQDGNLTIEITSQKFPIWIVAGVVGGIVIIIGSVTFFFVRRRIKKPVS